MIVSSEISSRQILHTLTSFFLDALRILPQAGTERKSTSRLSPYRGAFFINFSGGALCVHEANVRQQYSDVFLGPEFVRLGQSFTMGHIDPDFQRLCDGSYCVEIAGTSAHHGGVCTFSLFEVLYRRSTRQNRHTRALDFVKPTQCRVPLWVLVSC